MTRATHDLIIVGASFAGLACAQAAARNNLKTLVVEKKQTITDAVHTTGILVKEIADFWQVPNRLTRKIQNIRLYSPSLEYIDLHAPDYYFLATDTPGLLQWHANQAMQAGACIKTSCKYTRSTYKDGLHTLINLDSCSKFLVGADGARSRVARNYQLGLNNKFLAGIEAEFPPIQHLPDNILHIFLDSEISPGYIGWLVPGVRCTQAGLACRFPTAPRLRHFIEKISPVINLLDQSPFSHRAGLIPCGGINRFYNRNNVMLLGDAAGMVSPLTAGGIHPAIYYGFLAGEYISDQILHDMPLASRRLASQLPAWFFKKSMRNILDYFTPGNRFIDKTFSSSLFRALAQTVFFHHRGLLSKDAWRDIGRIFKPS